MIKPLAACYKMNLQIPKLSISVNPKAIFAEPTVNVDTKLKFFNLDKAMNGFHFNQQPKLKSFEHSCVADVLII